MDQHGQLYVAVDYRGGSLLNHEYRVIRLDNNHHRYGAAIWVPPQDLENTGKRSKGSLVTYRANQYLEAELEGRGCTCQCCIHTAMPRSDFGPHTGEMRQ